MTSRKQARRRREAASGAGWGIFLTALVATSLAGGYFAWSYASSRVQIDEATLCPEDGATGATMVLLDLTDPLTRPQGDRLGTLLEKRVAELPEGTMISFGVVGGDVRRRGSIFSSCKPADGREASQIYENPAMIKARFEENFMVPLRAALDEAMRAPEESHSPIMESLQALIADTPEFETGEGPHDLVIVSDLLQNSEEISFYRGEGWQTLEGRGGAGRLAGNLQDARVTIMRIPRPGAASIPHEQVDDFWSRYFDRQGARPPVVEALGDL
ncbi:hypothetical protein [uncultured Jannaschia sp.]|uniref:hypothetical protein n=1 Tax=uncultured Jannaschia sp. TaxID=293347 RepID=UPI00260DDB68|nr:hypothetical protein [uncultured Jannaschia sp.]